MVQGVGMKWSERAAASKVIITCAAGLVVLGLLLGVALVVIGYWPGLGGAATLVVGGGVAYWVATNRGGPSTSDS